mgnify:CR=1 FL=1
MFIHCPEIAIFAENNKKQTKNKPKEVTGTILLKDIDPNINDIAEEIGRLYGYHNLASTLPKLTTRRGVYVGDVKIRKEISKRLRALGINETKTYTLTSPDMANTFNYENKTQITFPNPMTIDKSVIKYRFLSTGIMRLSPSYSIGISGPPSCST